MKNSVLLAQRVNVAECYAVFTLREGWHSDLSDAAVDIAPPLDIINQLPEPYRGEVHQQLGWFLGAVVRQREKRQVNPREQSVAEINQPFREEEWRGFTYIGERR